MDWPLSFPGSGCLRLRRPSRTGSGCPEPRVTVNWPHPAAVLFMNFGLWQRLRHYTLGDLAQALWRAPGRAIELLKIPAPEAAQLMDRITTLERDIMLPIKVAGDRDAALFVLLQAGLDREQGVGRPGDRRGGHPVSFCGFTSP